MHPRNAARFMIVSSLILAFLLLAVPQANAQMGPPLRAGAKAPDFVTTTLAGHRLSLQSLRGHVVLLDFWATWCVPCQMATPAMQALHRRFHRRGLKVIGISLDTQETKAQIRGYKKKFGMTYTIAYAPDANVKTAMAYHTNHDPNTPEVKFDQPVPPAFFLIDKKGRVRWSQIGYSLDERHELTVRIKKLLAERG